MNMTEEAPASNTTQHEIAQTILTTVYSVAFIGGVTGVLAMSFFLVKMNTLSMTTTAIVNLVVVHSLLLLTVPFRLHYYINGKWVFGLPFCKAVSATLHIHMYLTFLFYIVTLVIRWLIFFQWKDKVEFYRKLHAVGASAAVWTVVSLIVVPVFCFQYGTSGTYNNTTCFNFQEELKQGSVKILNYIMIISVFCITCILLALQIFIILRVVKRLSGSVWSHQEFWAQIKSLIFLTVIIICFLPYHLFRIYYIQHMNEMNQLLKYNEITLSITAISCLDLLAFVLGGSRLLKQKVMVLRNKFTCC
ncbi:PREDICTED: probable G-protein coupled receptor 141 [Crocodylus porosus]|nr:PREDICTED: probable G-protein coupled receptor 141 [Crocodylus porosus]XP_019394308.1 PREDICTED: probable G-protein coupled receptor 141 [Crocodylus porosus]XP_019394317.1 PREDICTED: probable G-protein coupled receptor 141 [Crocodylus porosus]